MERVRFPTRPLYASDARFVVDTVLFPVKMIIPQPLIAYMPWMLTNEQIRTGLVGHRLQGRVLDIGCGTNRMIQEYRKKGGDGIGVDIFPWPGADLIVNETANLPFPEDSFDTISFVACFNHIPNRENVLEEAKRLLRANGQVILTNLSPPVSFIWHTFNHFWGPDQKERGIHSGEVMGFNKSELLRIFADHGFRNALFFSFSWGLNQLYIFQPKTTPANSTRRILHETKRLD